MKFQSGNSVKSLFLCMVILYSARAEIVLPSYTSPAPPDAPTQQQQYPQVSRSWEPQAQQQQPIQQQTVQRAFPVPQNYYNQAVQFQQPQQQQQAILPVNSFVQVQPQQYFQAQTLQQQQQQQQQQQPMLLQTIANPLEAASQPQPAIWTPYSNNEQVEETEAPSDRVDDVDHDPESTFAVKSSQPIDIWVYETLSLIALPIVILIPMLFFVYYILMSSESTIGHGNYYKRRSGRPQLHTSVRPSPSAWQSLTSLVTDAIENVEFNKRV